MKKILAFMVVCLMTTVSTFAQYSTYRSSGYSYGSTRSNYGGSTFRSTTTVPVYGITNTNVRYQQGYTRNNGTAVSGHYKTQNNYTNHDNFSTRGNINTYTGSTGTRARDYSAGAYNYGVGKTIQTGSRGGQYYINSNGNKTYVPKRW